MQNEFSEFGIILLFLIGGLLFTMVVLTVAKLLRPDRPNSEKLSIYECGEEAVGNPWGQINIRFYIIALIFILFEVEIIFLFPWATIFGQKDIIEGTNGKWGWFSLVEILVFVGILLLGLAYVWAKGFLDWLKPEQEEVKFETKIPRSLYEAINKKFESNKK